MINHLPGWVSNRKLYYMEALYLEGTDETAGVILDGDKGIFEINGRSLPEDAADFFEPVFHWLRKYLQHPNPETNFIFRLDYYNTASSKFIQDILTLLETGKGVKVTWYYHEDDEDLEEAGKNFSEIIALPFEFKSYP